MTKEKAIRIRLFLQEKYKDPSTQIVALANYDQPNGDDINQLTYKKTQELTDESTYELLADLDDSLTMNDYCNHVMTELILQATRESGISLMLRQAREAVEVERKEQLELLSRVLQYLSIYLSDKLFEFKDTEDPVTKLVLSELHNSMALWFPKNHNRNELEGTDVDRAVFVVAFITKQLRLNNIKIWMAFYSMLQPILRVFYNEPELEIILNELGQALHSFDKSELIRIRPMTCTISELL